MTQCEDKDPPEMQLLLEDIACEEEEACRNTPPGHTSMFCMTRRPPGWTTFGSMSVSQLVGLCMTKQYLNGLFIRKACLHVCLFTCLPCTGSKG